MSDQGEVEHLLARYIEHRERHGTAPDLDALCADHPALRADHPALRDALDAAVERYEGVERTLDLAPLHGKPTAEAPASLPTFPGFRTVERLGRGGMGEVYKLEDLKLGRIVAAKVLRQNSTAAACGDFLREARALALFQDARIVQIHELRTDATPPFLLMEYVDGFPLDALASSLPFAQRAHLVQEICDAVHHAHTLGIQHRDLKPANILVDARMRPRIIDFGLSDGHPGRGHGVGTPAYLAPEQLDPSRPIDARTDVYALGVILYELLCGALPYDGADPPAVAAAITAARPRLPVEIEPSVPEPLQAIALKAMDHDPAARYASAQEMARDLARYRAGRPVLARPLHYASALERRVGDHLQDLRAWLTQKLIYPHEAQGLQRAYRRLARRDEDWIVESRELSFARITLYLGAFLLLCGGFFYAATQRLYGAIDGIAHPLLALGLPCAGLTAAAHGLDRRGRKAVAVAFFLAAAALLPFFLLALFDGLGLWPTTEHDALTSLGLEVADRQWQVAALAATVFAFWLALRTHTVALSAFFAAAGAMAALALLAERGLGSWIDEGRWDLLAIHLLPLLVFHAVLGGWMERRGRGWMATPLYLGAAVLYLLILALLALDGRLFAHLGLSLGNLGGLGENADPTRLDTLAALSLDGLLIYLAGAFLERYGSPLTRPSARLFFVVTPFAVLTPLFALNVGEDYAAAYGWLYLGLALLITLLSRVRQRKAFYVAGVLNTGLALYLIAERYDWLEGPAWALIILVAGLATLALGVALDAHERRRRR